jgi:hypothetical protein
MHNFFRFGRLVFLMTALFITAGVFGCATTKSTAPTDPSTQTEANAEKRSALGQVQHPVSEGPTMVTYYHPPSRIDFCGESVPLENQQVLERFDKEFTLVVHNRAQVYWWLKRKGRYFPWIEERLRSLNLPEDLKYLAIAEIEPPLNAKEKRKPAEMRYDFQQSPDGALLYLGDLYRSFKSWSLAIAAYKCGERCIMDASSVQGERAFYGMVLPEETERYVFRILAIKAVLSDPKRYGYELPKGAGYR